MTIYDNNNQVLLDIPVDDDSYRYRAIMQGKKVSLHYSLPGHVDVPAGSYIEYQGERYTLWYPENFRKMGTREFEYTVEFGGNEELLKTYKFKLLSQKPYKLKFSFTATPRTFLQLLVDNLNLYDSGWTAGTCIEAPDKALAFNHESCFSVLSRLASEFNTEWEVSGKTIHLCKVEKFKDDPVALSYGRGNGFVPGVGRTNQGDKQPVTLLYVQGGERNINSASYGSPSLLLPLSAELTVDGRRYKTDADGMYVTRADRPLTAYNEDSFDASHLYPSRVGRVTAVETEAATDADGKPVTHYNIVDSTIPAALNYRDCRLPGQKATLIFQSGRLAGREFDIEQTADELTGYDPARRRFKLVSLREGNAQLPNEALYPAVGDTYAVFNITLPAAYVCDNATKSGASWDMFREAVRYFAENEQPQFSFKGELDGIWAARNWLAIGGKLQPGGYVLFSDAQFQPEGIAIRITGVNDRLNTPHSPTIELSNTPVAGFAQDEMGKNHANEVVNENLHANALSFTQRRFRDLEETGRMLEAAIEGFSSPIDPIYIQTMSLQVGSEALQFRFVNSKTSPTVVQPSFTYNASSKVLTATSGILQHMTLGIKEISSAHKPSDYKFWDMAAYTSPPLDEPEALYFYARCSKNSSAGTYLLSRTPYKMDSDGYYYFLVGTLSRETDAVRSFVTVYGFTEILPGRITTDKIVSADGRTYFDLADNEIGGKITFTNGSSGYSNLADKPDLSLYSTKTMLNAVKDDLINQIDGKIDMYYQTGNPWNSWASGTASEHVGDLWYNTSTKELKRYRGPSLNTWDAIEDARVVSAAADAAAALSTANTASGLAQTKRRVFTATPYPPYDKGDMWVQGSTGDIVYCSTARSSGSYYYGDWSIASKYDKTKTVIDGGVITTGSITFGDNGGMSGSGTIRIWSGGTASNPTFKVHNNGDAYTKSNFYAMNANGDVKAGFNGGNSSTDSGIMFFCGSNSPTSAPFRIQQDGSAIIQNAGLVVGKMSFLDSFISGKSGQINFDGGKRKFTLSSNSYMDESTSPVLSLTAGASPGPKNTDARRWIECTKSSGWGACFIVESRHFPGDDIGLERTVIGLEHMVSTDQLIDLVGEKKVDFKPVYLDVVSGTLVVKYK